MKYAVIRTGGKQYRVALGDVIDIELVEAIESNGSKTVQFDEVLFFFDGTKTQIGLPVLADFPVVGKVLGEVKGEKIKSVKYKPSHNERKRWGHRQHMMRVEITGIGK